VEEKHLLEALSRWAPKLVVLELKEVALTSVHGGWLPILRLISTMPKLKHLTLWVMAEKSPTTPGPVVISMSHLVQGRKIVSHTRMLPNPQQTDGWGREYSGRNAVVSGLDEVLTGRLRYQAF
jgi:hypothetical protein